MTLRDSYDRTMVRYIIRREIIAHWLRRKLEWASTVVRLYKLHRMAHTIEGKFYPSKPVLQALDLALRQAGD